jgi:hypothetical protein
MLSLLQFTAVSNMPKYEINVTKTSELTLLVDAASYEEALSIYENGEDLDGYECSNQDIKLDTIVKVAD